jgi:hypothetical protein
MEENTMKERLQVGSKALGFEAQFIVPDIINRTLRSGGYEPHALPGCTVTLHVEVENEDGPIPTAPTAVYAKKAEMKGRVVQGKTDSCEIEDCRGVALCVEWPDSKTTWPCTAGMFIREDGQWQIEE